MVELIYILICLTFILICYNKKEKIKKYLNIPKEARNFYIMLGLLIFSATATKLKFYIVLRALSVIIVVFMIIHCYGRNSLKLKRNIIALILLCFLSICLVSVIYSVNRLETLVKVIELLCDLIVIWLIFTYDKPANATKNIFSIIVFTYIVQLCMMTFGFFVAPSFFTIKGTKGVLGIQMGGGILGANGTGVAAIIPIIWCLNVTKSKLRNMVFLLAMFALILAQSRTSLIILCIILFVNLILTRNKIKYLLIFSILFLIGLQNLNHIMNYFNRGAATVNISTMSGRTIMWELAKVKILEKPFLGYGFGAGGYIVSSMHHNMSSLHNGVFEVLMGVGFIGFSFIIIAYIISSVQLAFNCLTKGLAKNAIEVMILILLTIRTYTSISIGGWHSIEILLWYYLIFAVDTIKSHNGIKYNL